MEDIIKIIMNISLSTWISLGALIISILGFLKARESLKHSKKISEENRLLEAEKERTELLYMISEEKELIENLISDLEGLKIIYDNEDHFTQTKLKITQTYLMFTYPNSKKD